MQFNPKEFDAFGNSVYDQVFERSGLLSYSAAGLLSFLEFDVFDNLTLRYLMPMAIQCMIKSYSAAVPCPSKLEERRSVLCPSKNLMPLASNS